MLWEHMQQDIMDYLMASPSWDSQHKMLSHLGVISKLIRTASKQHEAGNECAPCFSGRKVLILQARRTQFFVSLWWFT